MPKIRTYNTWIKEGANRFTYRGCQNPIHRLLAAGYNRFDGGDTILFTKADVKEYIEAHVNDNLEFVYLDYGSYYHFYSIYVKQLPDLNEPEPDNHEQPDHYGGYKINRD